MRMSPEIKEFTKNTLIFTLFFTLVLHLSWGYIAPYFGVRVSANNDANFSQANIVYMGNIATAFSLNIGREIRTSSGNTHTPLYTDYVSMAEALSDPHAAETRLIGANMMALQSYVNVLKTDVAALLEESGDRASTLDEHIDILKSYYVRTSERITNLSEQRKELQSIITTSSSVTIASKAAMDEKYKKFEYQGTDIIIDDYVRAKNEESRARVYAAYLERFQRGYTILQAQNKKILDTLINNREALIKQAVIVIPDSGSDLLKKLNLITTEADYKASLEK
jgi:hypothetical protein